MDRSANPIRSALIVGGWLCDESTGWIPAVREELGYRGIESRFCGLANTFIPSTKASVRKLARLAGGCDSNRVVIAYSFGCKVSLAALSTDRLRAAALILVAPLYRWPFFKWLQLWADYVNFERLRANCSRLIILHSKDDWVVPFRNSERLMALCERHAIDAEFMTFDHSGHFAPQDGCYELPEVLEVVDSLRAPLVDR